MARPSFNPQGSSSEEDSNDERPNPDVGNDEEVNDDDENEDGNDNSQEEEVDYQSTPLSRYENETTNFGNDTTNFEGYGYPVNLNQNWDDDEESEAEETRIEIETFFKVGGGKGARKTVPKTAGTGNKKSSAGGEGDDHNLDKDKNWTAPVNPFTQMLPGIPPATGGSSSSGMAEVPQPFEYFTNSSEGEDNDDDDNNNNNNNNDPSSDPSDGDDGNEPSPSPSPNPPPPPPQSPPRGSSVPPTGTNNPPASVLTIPYSSYQRLPDTGLHIQVQPGGPGLDLSRTELEYRMVVGAYAEKHRQVRQLLEAKKLLEVRQPEAQAMPQAMECDHLPENEELPRNLKALQDEFDVEWAAGVAALAAAGTVEDGAAAEKRRKEAVEEILGFPNMEIIKERMVSERFLRLRGLVADLAKTYFAGDEVFKELSAGVGGRVDVALNEMVKSVLVQKTFPLEDWNAPLFMEAVVWQALRREIFGIDSEVWGDKFGAFMFRYFSDMTGEFLRRGDAVLEAGLMGSQTKSLIHVQSSSPNSTSSGRAWSTALAAFTSTCSHLTV